LRFVSALVAFSLAVMVAIPVLAQDDMPDELSEEPTDLPPPPPGLGSILLSDNFDDPAAGFFPRSSNNPLVAFEYLEGEYRIARLDPTGGSAMAKPPAIYADLSVAADGRLTSGDPTRSALIVGARYQPDGSGYQASLVGSYLQLQRWDSDRNATTELGRATLPAEVLRPGANRLELVLAGQTVYARLNDRVAVVVQDDRYSAGQIGIGVWGNAQAAEARFDNAVVTQRSAAEAAPPVAAEISRPLPPSSPTAGALAPTITPIPAPSCAIASPWPLDFVITAPATGLPTTLTAFLGVWEGTWTSAFGDFRSRLGVERVDQNEAIVIYAYPSQSGAEGTWSRSRARVTGGNTIEFGTNVRFTFRMGADGQSISGEREQGGSISRVTKSRCTP
jgi:hypothetical protein